MNCTTDLVITARTVIGDFDDVVADTEPVRASAYEAMLDRCGVGVDRDPGLGADS